MKTINQLDNFDNCLIQDKYIHIPTLNQTNAQQRFYFVYY